jgi:hypothetical protein
MNPHIVGSAKGHNEGTVRVHRFTLAREKTKATVKDNGNCAETEAERGSDVSEGGTTRGDAGGRSEEDGGRVALRRRHCCRLIALLRIDTATPGRNPLWCRIVILKQFDESPCLLYCAGSLQSLFSTMFRCPHRAFPSPANQRRSGNHNRFIRLNKFLDRH